MKRLYVVFAIYVFTAGIATAANITTRNSGFAVNFIGQIKQGDSKIISSLVAKRNNAPLLLSIDSVGGDIEEAMKIGKLLRYSRSSVVVDDDARCMSSCVLVLAGAVSRIVHERAVVAIHRPFNMETKKINTSRYDKEFKALKSKVSLYLYEMNVPSSLFDRMSSIPSELIYVFNPDELRLYHLNINDPGEDAIRNDKEANNYGLAMDVYLQRKGVANYKCTPLFPDISEDENTGLIKLNKYNNCIESVMQNGE